MRKKRSYLRLYADGQRKNISFQKIIALSVLLILSTFTLSANIQNTKISLRVKNASLTDIFKRIENQSEFRFFFQNEQVAGVKNKTVDAVEKTIDNVLSDLLSDTNISYRIVDNHIIVFPKETGRPVGLDSNQQTRTISGKITDEFDEPLMGVSILIKGTTQGVMTDIDGNYTLSNIPEDAILQVSYIGMRREEIRVGNQSVINIVMKEDAIGLEEVVAIGYGTRKKSDLTGASGSVKSDVLAQRTVTSFNQALSGKVSGVNISTNTGRPGGRASVRIRGNSSISVTNDPLYVVDGVILNVSNLTNGTSPIDYLNPNDIQAVEILKDASATAIYGARGANGVILITTKRGEGTGPTIKYDADFGIGVLPKKLSLLNAEEFLRTEELAYQNAQKYDPEGWASGAYTDPRTKRTNPLLFDSAGNPLYDTDWQDEAIRNAFSQTHQISVSNNKGKDAYGFSLGYRGEEGLIVESWMKRYSGRVFVDTELTSWLKVGGSINYIFQNERQTDSMGDGGITVGRQIIEALPFLPVKYADGSWAGNADYPGMEGGNNPVHVAKARNLSLETQTMIGNVYANFTILPGLEFRTVFGSNIINQKTSYYAGKELIWISAPNGRAYIANNKNNSWQFENYLTYNKIFSDIHSFTGLLGISWQHVDNAHSQANASGFEDDFFSYNNLGVATTQTVSSTVNAYGLNSYFARVNYDLKNRYLLTATGRIDGSSKFGSNNRYAFFPSAGGAWRVTEEEFMEDVSFLSNLKPRVSFGITGNSETGAYAWQGALGTYNMIFNDAKATGTGIATLANPDLKWEKTAQTNVGLDIGLFDNRINIEFDWYYKKTTDMLLAAPVPFSSGYESMTKNIGSMENRGVEFSLHTINISTKDFSWETNFNISFNKNKVLALGDGNDDIYPGPDILSNSNNIVRVGEPVGSFYGYKRLGTWGTHEADEAAKYGLLPGDLKLWDRNGDGEINDADRLIIGKGIPDGYGTFTNTFRYKNFDLVVELQYMFGNDVLDISKHSGEDRTGIANSYRTVLNAWTPENQNTMIAQIRPTGAGYQTNIDSHFIEDGSFIRGRNLLLGYNFPRELVRRMHLKNLRVYGSVQNFFLVTKYSGYDPEVSDATQTFAQGITVANYPKPRTFTIGLNVTF